MNGTLLACMSVGKCCTFLSSISFLVILFRDVFLNSQMLFF